MSSQTSRRMCIDRWKDVYSKLTLFTFQNQSFLITGRNIDGIYIIPLFKNDRFPSVKQERLLATRVVVSVSAQEKSTVSAVFERILIEVKYSNIYVMIPNYYKIKFIYASSNLIDFSLQFET